MKKRSGEIGYLYRQSTGGGGRVLLRREIFKVWENMSVSDGGGLLLGGGVHLEIKLALKCVT